MSVVFSFIDCTIDFTDYLKNIRPNHFVQIQSSRVLQKTNTYRQTTITRILYKIKQLLILK